MTVEIAELEPETREFLLNELRATYLDRYCYELALALHQGLGWQLYGLWKNQTIRHAFVRFDTKVNRYLDARGEVALSDIIGTFGGCESDIEEIHPDDFSGIRDIDDSGLRRARIVAETLWPELPWVNRSESKFVRFARELEALCERHGVYIRSDLPTTCPVLYERYGDEVGFTLYPSPSASQMRFDRRLKR